MKNEYTDLVKSKKDLVYRLNKTVCRLKAKIENGSFLKLSRKHKHQLLKRLRRYMTRLQRIGYQHAIAASIFGLAMSLTFSSNAQITFEKDDNVIIPITTDTSQINSSILLSDLDNDGDLDVVLARFNFSNYETTFDYFSNGGSATEPNFTQLEGEANPFNEISVYDLGFANMVDLDNDGDQDLIYMEYYGAFFYLKNEGNAEVANFVLQEDSPFDEVTASYPSKAPLVDLDGDGDLDLLLYGSVDSLYNSAFYRNTGDASNPVFTEEPFETSPFSQLPDTEGGVFPAFEDLDGDGDYDLVVTVYSGIQYYKNEGSVTEPEYVLQDEENNPFQFIFDEDPDILGFIFPTFGDLDDDADLDLVTLDFGYEVDYYENTSTLPSSVEGQEIQTLNIYPTLTSGIINIEQSQHNGMELLDMNGRIISTYKGGETQIDVSSFPSGAYHLRVNIEGAPILTKIMKM